MRSRVSGWDFMQSLRSSITTGHGSIGRIGLPMPARVCPGEALAVFLESNGEQCSAGTIEETTCEFYREFSPRARYTSAITSGALRQFIDLQNDNDAYYFVADYHALTSVRDARLLREYTFDVIVTMLSLGLDPDRATLFVQSDVPETTELTWLLSSVTPMGWLEKCVSYKDKIQQGLPAEHGLFAYPVLQAADILLYDADLVPVGQDQKQHLEITRDVAERFNRVFGDGKDVFRLPKPHILDAVAVVPGVDGRKMSKSYNNTIEIFDDPATIKKKVKKIVTDSTPVEAPKNPDTCPLFNLFRLFASPGDLTEVERRYREGGIGYGEVKSRLAEAMIARFSDARDRRADWLAHPGRVAEVRAAGAAQGDGPHRPRPGPCRLWGRLNENQDHRPTPFTRNHRQVYNDALPGDRLSLRQARPVPGTRLFASSPPA